MDLSTISRIQIPLLASAAHPTAPSGHATSRPSAVRAQKLGVKFSSVNGKSIKEGLGITGRTVNHSAQRNKSGLKVRAEQIEQIDVTPALVQTIERRLVNGRSVDQEIVTLKGKVTLSRTIGTDKEPGCSFLDFQENVWFTLVSAELDAHRKIIVDTFEEESSGWYVLGRTEQGKLKESAKTQIQDDGEDADDFYTIGFSVPSDFGEPGALIVESKNSEEFYLISLHLKSADSSTQYEFACNSWINQKNGENYNKIIAYKDQYRKYFNNETLNIDRIFFTNKAYLPQDTPAGLRQLRALELETLRGDGTGERKAHDRIYDYDIYNDLGNPEENVIRTNLGGPGNIPFPRRCRTGRKVDEATGMETLPPFTSQPGRREKIYVPRDEDFSRVKESGFNADQILGFRNTLLPILTKKFSESPDDFDTLLEVFGLYKDGVGFLPESPHLQPTPEEKKAVIDFLNEQVFQSVGGINGDLTDIKYPTPQVIQEDSLQWMTDEEFGRKTLAGINPVVIRRVKVFPPTSDLSEDVYGPATALTAQHIEPHLQTLGKPMTVTEAIAQKRLFTIDYHDVYLPYVNKINSQKDTKRFLYAPRALFFLTDDHKMMPVAIELSLPPPQHGENKPLNKVFTPVKFKNDLGFEWELAKLHFSSVDFGYHELVSHLLRCHVVMEPFIIASHRQLSAMHPIFVLLDPCFVNTMRINANARDTLISAAPNGTIEVNFTTGQYGTEMAAVAYDKLWRFDKAGLPQDLLDRGMAEPDFSQPEGVKLLFDDYPFAKDGLDIYRATKEYITGYVNLFYTSDEKVLEDEELQAWWKEIRQVGHGDKKDEKWWPSCKDVGSLIDILCTIFWIAGPQHAAVNFGQYGYSGFMPNSPPMTRRPIPEPDTSEYRWMLFNFERYVLKVASSPEQTVSIMTTLEVLSSHAKDEEYIGQRSDCNWTSNPKVKEVLSKYADRICLLERMFEQRNLKAKLGNRHGAFRTPGYTLMYPTSGEGVTGKGVPWSISI